MTDSDLQSIAVFGGSFDPVHNGHVMIARSALAELELDRLIVMPAAQSPFKPDQTLAPAAARMEMLRAAFSGEPEIEISSWELDRGGISYSIETLRALAAEHPEAQLFYLIGADHVATLPQWREADALAAKETMAAMAGAAEAQAAQLEAHLRLKAPNELERGLLAEQVVWPKGQGGTAACFWTQRIFRACYS